MTFKFDTCPQCKNPRYLRGKPCIKCGYRPPSFWMRHRSSWLELLYILLGLFTPSLLYISLFVILYLSEQSGLLTPEGISTVGLILSLSLAGFILYITSLGKYGNVTIPHILVIILWSIIPILNLTLIYYLGKGLYLYLTSGERS